MGKLNRKNISVSLILIISLCFLIHTFKDVEFSKLIVILKGVKPFYIILWVVIFLIGTIGRAYRWKLLLPKGEHTLSNLFHSLNIGNLATMILPFRAGEFVRPFYLSRWSEVSFAKSMISVILERVFDVIGMFVMFYFFVSDVKNIPEVIQLSANGLGYLCIFLVLGIVFARFFPSTIRRIAIFFFKLLPTKFYDPLLKIFDEVLGGLGAIRHFSQLSMIISLTLLLWLSYAYSFSLILESLSSDSVTMAQGAITTVFVALAIAAPNAPGFLLTFEMGASAALSVFAYPQEFSLAFALIAHFCQLFSTILLGLFSLWSKGLTLKSLKTS